MSKFKPSRVDKNQPEIVAEFRRLGCSVECTHFYADGFPDILVGVAGMNLLVEIKNGAKPPSQRKLTRFQDWWHMTWQGRVIIVETIEQVREIVGRAREFMAAIEKHGIEGI